MTRKGILGGAAALVALGLALIDVNNVEAGRRRCCCNGNGWSGNYGTTQMTGYGPSTPAPAPQTYDGSTQNLNGTAAPAPAYNSQGTVRGNPYGTQYGPRGTTNYGSNGATGTVREGTTINPGTNRDGTSTSVNPRTGTNAQGRQAAPAQQNQNRTRIDAPPPPPAADSTAPDSTEK